MNLFSDRPSYSGDAVTVSQPYRSHGKKPQYVDDLTPPSCRVAYLYSVSPCILSFFCLTSGHCIQKNCASDNHMRTSVSDKRSGLAKGGRFERRHPHQRRDFLLWPQNSGAAFATFKNKINSSHRRTLFSSRGVLRLRQNYTLWQSCPGTKQNAKNGT